MWIAAFVAGWVLVCVTFYAYLISTAKEPAHGECVECRRMECTDCSYLADSKQELKRAA